MLNVRSDVFGSNKPIPKEYTGEGQDVSPPLSWSGAPDGTQSFAVVCDDPDAPQAEPWVHWVLFNLPPKVTELSRGAQGFGKIGINSFGHLRYGGPMPPPGHGTHHYHFKVYALDQMLPIEAGASKQDVLQAAEGHILAEGELVGTYER